MHQLVIQLYSIVHTNFTKNKFKQQILYSR